MSVRAGAPLFARELERWGDAPALIQSGLTVSYKALAQRADAFAKQLSPAVRLLAIDGQREVEPIVAYLGALRAGVPVMLQGADPIYERSRAACPPDARFWQGDDGRWRLDESPHAWTAPPHPALAVLLATSGSTGSAKLVRLSGANLDANARSISAYLGLNQAERAVASLPLHYSYGLSVLNSHLAAGASIVLTAESVASDAFREIIVANGVTSIAGVPHSYELMDRCGLLADLPRSIRTLTQAGGRMTPEMISRVLDQTEAAGVRLFVMYGQTEATARMAYLPPERVRAEPSCIGGPIPGGELWVEDDTGARLRDGREGALVYRGPNVMMGYADSREGLALPPGPDVLRTGDLAAEVAPGVFRITGRQSRIVKPFGLRVALDDLEAICREHGVIATVAGDDTRIVVAAAAEMLPKARAAVANLKLPPELFTYAPVEAPPRLDSGKIDYPALLRLADAQSPRIDGDEDLRATFALVARQRPLTDESTFQDLGGDSLNYVQCSIGIERALGFLPLGWEEMTLGQLLAMAPKEPPSAARRLTTMEPDALARCAAIMLIVTQHALIGLPIHTQLGSLEGGSHTLLLLAGLSFGRFQRVRLLDGAVWPTVRDFMLRYISFYFLFAALVSVVIKYLVSGTIVWSYVLMISTYSTDRIQILIHFWFLESLAWVVLGTCLLFGAPALRKLARARPTLFGALLVGLGLVLHVLGIKLHGVIAHRYYSPDVTFVYFAAGWALATTNVRPIRFGLALLLGGLAAYDWGLANSHWVVIGGAALFIAAGPRIKLPTSIGAPILAISSASFYIYQVNFIAIYSGRYLGAPAVLYWPASIGLTLLMAFAVKYVVENRAMLLRRFAPPFLQRAAA